MIYKWWNRVKELEQALADSQQEKIEAQQEKVIKAQQETVKAQQELVEARVLIESLQIKLAAEETAEEIRAHTENDTIRKGRI